MALLLTITSVGGEEGKTPIIDVFDCWSVDLTWKSATEKEKRTVSYLIIVNIFIEGVYFKKNISCLTSNRRLKKSDFIRYPYMLDVR